MTGLTTAIVLQAMVLSTGAQPYATAYNLTEKNGKPLLVLVGADWCPACQEMKSATLKNMEKKGKLQGVEFTIVNTDRDERLANRLMRGSTIPQLILFERTPSGWRRTQLTGGQGEGQVASFIGRAVVEFQARRRKAEEVSGGE